MILLSSITNENVCLGVDIVLDMAKRVFVKGAYEILVVDGWSDYLNYRKIGQNRYETAHKYGVRTKGGSIIIFFNDT